MKLAAIVTTIAIIFFMLMYFMLQLEMVNEKLLEKYKEYKCNFDIVIHLLYKLVQSKNAGDYIKVSKNLNNSLMINLELYTNGIKRAKHYIKYPHNCNNNNISKNSHSHNNSSNTTNDSSIHNTPSHNSTSNRRDRESDREKNKDKITLEFHNLNVKSMHDMVHQQ